MRSGALLVASSDGPSFRVMQEALVRYVRGRGLRPASREIGMSATGVEKLVSGAARPNRVSVRKLEQWYVRAARN